MNKGKEIGLAALLLVVAGALSYAAALTESFTVDEPAHLTSGASILATGDYRLNPEHPPLVKLWAVLPLRFVEHTPWTPELAGWSQGATAEVALDWLEQKNDGNRLLRAPRAMMVVLFIGLVAAVGWTAQRLFGTAAGLLATAIAALDPALLAHGHYVTADVPLTLCVTLTLLSFAAFQRRPSTWTFLAAATSLSAAALVKYSWVLVVPALLLMTATAYVRHRACGTRRGFPWLLLPAIAVFVWGSIWGVYGFRFDPFRGNPASGSTDSSVSRPKDMPAQYRRLFSPATRDEAWQDVLTDRNGTPRSGPSVTLVTLGRRLRVLPEAYLYGLSHAIRNAESRPAYLHGQFSVTGWRWYFPIAYLIKAPLPELLLLIAGAAALTSGHVRTVGDPVLAMGLLAFAALYGTVAVFTNLNIGLRHILPIYPVLIVVASAAVAWAQGRTGKVVLFVALAWMVITALASFPYYLGYFNEAVGGWRNGYRWLVDSNLDWDQDFQRVLDYQRQHSDERLVFASLGDSPRPPGFRPEVFLPWRPDQPWPSPPSAGTYVISASWLVGKILESSRDEMWEKSQVRQIYEKLWRRFGRLSLPAAARDDPSLETYKLFDSLRRGLLLRRLRGRSPDGRIGTSSFVFRLTDKELALLTRPD